MTLHANFLEQALVCEAMGSPFTGQLCRLFAQNLARRCRVSERLLDWPGDTSHRGQSVPLRVAAAMHALVLSGRDSHMAALYPPARERVSDSELWQAIEHALLSHEGFILDWLQSPPQTNEPARSAVLRVGFQYLVGKIDRPLVLSEIGASAGLNLNWDRYVLNVGDRRFGPPDAPLTLTADWRGSVPPPDGSPVVRARQGCDLNPIDPRDPEQRLRLTAYTWPDQPARLARVTAALDFAALQPPKVVKQDALDWLGERLETVHSGAIHTVFSTLAWQYLDSDARATGAAMMGHAGAKSDVDAPLAWLRMESDGKADSAALTLQIWPDGTSETLARVDFHGNWIKWLKD